jgi:Escherichia/Staphylococcus phage prohead protease
MIERRSLLSAAGVEIRSGKPRIVGYAAVFNSPSEEMSLKKGDQSRRFREIIRPGAFAESLRSRADVLARFEHEGILGRVANGTLRRSEDSRGLRYEIDPPDTQLGRDATELIRRRDVAFSSFAFNVRTGGDSWRQDGKWMVREIRSVVLIDVTPTSRPAYPQTEVALRSFDEWQRTRGLADMRLELAERL